MSNIFEYTNPIISEMRNVHVPISQPAQIVNGHVILQELADTYERVQVIGGDIDWIETNNPKEIKEDEYYVDYVNSIVYFHPSRNLMQVTLDLYGKGVAFFPASRIYTGQIDGSVTEVLSDYLDNIKDFKYVGIYDNETVYKAFNMVSFNGGTYLCLAEESVGIDPTNSSHWVKIANFAFKGMYNPETIYLNGDFITNSELTTLYMCKKTESVGDSLDDQDTWHVVIDVSEIVQSLHDLEEQVSEAENIRISNENDRVQAENDREDEESIRISNEEDRVLAEVTRENNEDLRINAENDRDNAENIRISNEDERKDNELLRIDAENIRISNEDKRVQAENIREDNETLRVDTYNNFNHKDEYDSLIEYKKFNIVSFNGSSYMCIEDSLGNLPLDTNYWKLIGEKGDKGATLTPKGAYDSSTLYQIGDLVSYDGSVYNCIQESLDNDPTDVAYWDLFMAGGGDMRRDIYDSNYNGIVDDSEKLGGEPKEYFENLALDAETNAKLYTDEQIELVTETGIPKLNSYQFKVVATVEGQTEFEIPMDTFNSTTDTLIVYQNTTHVDNSRYTITNTVENIDNTITRGYITLNEGVAISTEIIFLVLKNVPIGADGAISGSVIATNTLNGNRVLDDSIENDKLSPDIKIGSLSSLNTSDKSSVISAINEVIEDIESIDVPVTSVNNKTGDVELTAEDVGAAKASEFASHVADNVSHIRYASATGGGANAKTVTLNPAPSGLVDGLAISFKNSTENTGAVTLNVNGLGAKPIIKANGNALSSGNLKANSIYTVRYNGTNFILQGEGGEYGTAQAQHVLTPYTIGTENGIVTGTMPNRTGHVTGQSVSRTGTTLRIRPQAGHYPGDMANSVQWNDPNYLAENIREGVNLFGLTGSLVEGKKFASGSVTSTGGTVQTISISGLSFNPRVVVFMESTIGAPHGYVDVDVTYYGNDKGLVKTSTTNRLNVAITNISTGSIEFLFSYNRNETYNYIAYE